MIKVTALIAISFCFFSCSDKKDLVEAHLNEVSRVDSQCVYIRAKIPRDSIVFEKEVIVIDEICNSLLESIYNSPGEAYNSDLIILHFRNMVYQGPLLQLTLYNHDLKDHWLLHKYKLDQEDWLDQYINKTYPINVILLLKVLKKDLLLISAAKSGLEL